MIEIKDNMCLSGGAEGADLAWGAAALEAGHGLIHWSFSSHNPKQQKEYVVKLPREQLIIADDLLIETNKYLKRSFPSSSEHVNNLLRRNYFQIKDATSVYAISEIKNDMVQGGTAWACGMFMALHSFQPCPVYVFSQPHDKWFTWSNDWMEINDVPTPTKIYAGVGTRNLTENGLAAIQNIYR